jgi:hypothetical protein
MRFAGWGTQLFVMLAIAVFGGTRMDKWTGMSFPLFTLLFPFIVLIVMIYQLIKDTSKRKSNDEKE